MLKGMINLVKKDSDIHVPNGCSGTLNELFNIDLIENPLQSEKFISLFTSLDDVDMWSSIKNWQRSKNSTLSFLSQSFVNRKLFKIKFYPNLADLELQKKIKVDELKRINLVEDIRYLVQSGEISNKAYIAGDSTIKIAMKNGEIRDIINASDLPTIEALSNIVKKSYLSWVNPLYLR
jgi:hypothetical protein